MLSITLRKTLVLCETQNGGHTNTPRPVSTIDGPYIYTVKFACRSDRNSRKSRKMQQQWMRQDVWSSWHLLVLHSPGKTARTFDVIWPEQTTLFYCGLLQEANLSVCPTTCHGDVWDSENKSPCIQWKMDEQLRTPGQQSSVPAVAICEPQVRTAEKLAGNGTLVFQPAVNF